CSLKPGRKNTADQVRIRSDGDMCHRDCGDVAARMLATIDRLHRLQAGDENDEADHHRQHRPLDEKIGERLHFALWAMNPPASDSPVVSAREYCRSLPAFRCAV